ncbi:hypothetical protein [Thiobacillus sp.]|uniref:hypothetical protein n=1 Tax=Thiobacillus sp. TaxID=924 RepID=UPI001EBCB363|nr:hypothetical protein [Thiobacillus sp.]MBC2738615.1 hypothetical protein [Thiobacillus sp.]
MRIAELIQRWGQEGHAHPDARTYTVHLPLRDAARVEALHVMYPDCSDSMRSCASWPRRPWTSSCRINLHTALRRVGLNKTAPCFLWCLFPGTAIAACHLQQP